MRDQIQNLSIYHKLKTYLSLYYYQKKFFSGKRNNYPINFIVFLKKIK